MRTRLALVALACAISASPARAGGPLPEGGAGASAIADAPRVEFAPRPGAALPAQAILRDDDGRPVRLGDWFRGRRPVVLTFAAYDCPDLCPTVLDDLARRLRASAAGDCEVLVVGIDPREPPARAAARKSALLARIGRGDLAPHWHFLTGSAAEIGGVMRAAGFRATWVPDAHRYAHAIGVLVLTPRGRIARAFFGLGDPPGRLAAALREARTGAAPVAAFEPFVLRCFHLVPGDPRALAVFVALRCAGLLALLGVALLAFTLIRRGARESRAVPR